MADRPRLGISACLLGDAVRYNGGHKRDSFLAEVLAGHVDWVKVCPEVEVGMGTPREALHLVGDALGGVRLLTTATRVDHTPSTAKWADTRLGALGGERLSGYVLKKDSPSCGMAGVTVYSADGRAERSGRGVFAEALLARFPDLPVTEEGHLLNPWLREHFVERVFAHWRLCAFFAGDWNPQTLASFHAAHRVQLHAHSRAASVRLGQLVASASRLSRSTVRQRYTRGFTRAMGMVVNRRGHTAVLTRIARQLGMRRATAPQLFARIDGYRGGSVSLDSAVTLLRNLVQGHPALAAQTHLVPYPDELRLREPI